MTSTSTQMTTIRKTPLVHVDVVVPWPVVFVEPVILRSKCVWVGAAVVAVVAVAVLVAYFLSNISVHKISSNNLLAPLLCLL